MSASQEKKKRQGMDIDRRTRKNQEEAAKSRKNRRTYIIVGAIVVVFAIVVILFSSNFFYHNFTAVNINGTKYHVADYNYFYNTTYLNYYNNYSSYYGENAKDYMPDEETLKAETLSTMQDVTMLYDEAQAAGFALSDEQLQDIEDAMATIKANADSAGYPSLNGFLTVYYGKGMTEKIFRENLTRYFIATNYAQEVRESYEYSPEELANYYEENKDNYDKINYRSFAFAPNEDEEGIEEADIITAEDAEKLANEFADKITDEKSFIELAKEYAPESKQEIYQDDDATLSSFTGKTLTSYLDGPDDWLLSADRKAGDKTVMEFNGSYMIMYFISRDNNDYETVNAHHILISPSAVDETAYADDEAALEEAMETADQTAKSTAESILDEWKSGEATEESFAALADEYSQDSAAGGYYENIYHGQMSEELDAWLFDAARKPGDVELVHTEEHGYHIAYFCGTGMIYKDFLAETDLRNNDFSEWRDSLINDYTPSTTWLLGLA